MGAPSIESILGGLTLTGVIQDPKGGLPTKLPPALFQRTRGVEGNRCSYKRVNGNRELARLVQYGSPAVTRGHRGVSSVVVHLMHAFEQQSFDPLLLLRLMQPYSMGVAEGEIASQTGGFRMLFDNLRIAAVHSAFALGQIHIDGLGNLLPSDSGAAYSVDYEIPAGNRDQLDHDGNGDIIAAKWSDAGTDITSQIVALKTAATKLTGYGIRHAIYGANVLQYILGNTAMQNAFKLNSAYQAAAINGEIPDGLMGLSWHAAGSTFFVAADGEAKTVFDADSITFIPEISPDWYDLVEGSYMIPTNVGVGTEVSSVMLSNLTTVEGRFSYAVVTHNPVGVTQFAGDTFLPIIKVPGAVWFAKVHW